MPISYILGRGGEEYEKWVIEIQEIISLLNILKKEIQFYWPPRQNLSISFGLPNFKRAATVY